MKKAFIGAGVIVLAVALTGCGSASDKKTDPGSNTSAKPQGFDTGQFSKIQDCLKAAGLASDLPSNVPTDVPSNFPTDGSGAPGGAPSGFGGAGGAQLSSPAVQEALKACGISLPQAPGAGSAG